MKNFLALALAAALWGGPALAEPAGKITVAQGLSLLAGLRNLDGHQVIVKQGANESVVMVPWDFASGSLRLRIANNISILAPTEKAADDSKTSIIKELTRGKAPSIQPGTPEADAFVAQYQDVLNGPAPGTQDLGRIKASELKLDKNEIGGTTLSALAPILDDDVSKK